MSVTFRIIEGEYEDFPYEKIKHDYYNTNLFNREIQAKYDLTRSQWRRFLKKLKEEELLLKTRVDERMNFNIVEKKEDPFPYEDILEDYMNLEISVKEIKEKYGLTRSQWKRILKFFKEEGVVLRNTGFNEDGRWMKYGVKYYSKTPTGYRVHRTINGKEYGFGVYSTEKEAQERVQELHKSNWEGLL